MSTYVLRVITGHLACCIKQPRIRLIQQASCCFLNGLRVHMSCERAYMPVTTMDRHNAATITDEG